MVILTQRRIYLFCRFPGGDINSAGSVLAVVLVLQISWW